MSGPTTPKYDDPDPPRLTPDQWGRSVAHSYKVTAARMAHQDNQRMNQLLGVFNEAGALSEKASELVFGGAVETVESDRMAGFLSDAIGRMGQGDTADVPRIPPRTRNRHWDGAYALFAAEDTDQAVAGAFILQLLSIQEAACDLQTARRN
mgnify:CR=1 FL=1